MYVFSYVLLRLCEGADNACSVCAIGVDTQVGSTLVELEYSWTIRTLFVVYIIVYRISDTSSIQDIAQTVSLRSDFLLRDVY